MPNKPDATSATDAQEYSPPSFEDWDEDTASPDDTFSLDLSDAKESMFEPLAPGLYPAKLEEAIAGRSKRSNNPMVTYKFALDLPVNPDTGKKPSRKAFWPVPLTPDFYGRHKKIAITLDPEYDLKNFAPTRLSEQLAGLPCRLRLKIDRNPDDNSRVNKVTDVLPAESTAGAFLQ